MPDALTNPKGCWPRRFRKSWMKEWRSSIASHSIGPHSFCPFLCFIQSFNKYYCTFTRCQAWLYFSEAKRPHPASPRDDIIYSVHSANLFSLLCAHVSKDCSGPCTECNGAGSASSPLAELWWGHVGLWLSQLLFLSLPQLVSPIFYLQDVWTTGLCNHL